MTDATRSDHPTPSEQRAASASLGDLLSEVTGDLSTLMRQELALARAELKQSATNAGKGAGMLGGAGYAALMAVFFLSVALWWALGQLVGLGWSAVIVAVLWGVIGAVLFVVGKKQLQKVEGAPQTVDTLKRIPDAVKRNEENR
ncbi:phage holin family protein [Microbacterium sp. EYE_5]|uniref:phage holin family protein n=1 Tax=unclassified Microbacterium TaxID=2609290 RepID=UPI002002C6A9|nr:MULTISPECIES: phage holin family protein [unclassified Microbacterium]MCK6080946.1 phage holin family protein [Microbacterium sp. EYE_382]MCK6086217.1 phage holin family protein [Microbacterium sp. EYE_384]MCK6124285.1 phage holin family protein [Microbacterium sp. EYE_80]MCK6127194.1 phage holin family protein [Microbacterium sp. EYE_79]MCK6141901.1 phage holin family protein [Microbacterium sp. EYE_39]